MIPKIKRAEPFYRSYGYKYMVVGKHGIDMTFTLFDAIKYWLWHCGVPTKYCFK